MRRSRSGSGSFLVENKNGRFENVSVPAGIRLESSAVSGAFGDYDNDGNIDLYAVNDGPNRLYRNLGNGTFEDVTAGAELSDSETSEHALISSVFSPWAGAIFLVDRGVLL